MSSKAVPYNFCPVCGSPLQTSMIDKLPRRTCPDCPFVHWGDFSLGVGGVLWHDNKVLLVQRGYNPGKGMWTIPGGYVDQREPIGTAIVREIQEETGIIAQPIALIALRDQPGERHDAYLIFLMKFMGGNLHAQPEEVSDLGFFTLDECHNLPIPSLTLNALQASHSDSPGLILNSDADLLGALSALYQIP